MNSDLVSCSELCDLQGISLKANLDGSFLPHQVWLHACFVMCWIYLYSPTPAGAK